MGGGRDAGLARMTFAADRSGGDGGSTSTRERRTASGLTGYCTLLCSAVRVRNVAAGA